MELSIKGLFVTLSMLALNVECCYAEYHALDIIMLNVIMLSVVMLNVVEPHRLKRATAENTKVGSITVPLTSCFDWFGISCITTDNFCFYLQNRLIQTSQTGGQQYSDTSPFSIPWQQHFPSLQSKLCYVGGAQKNSSNLNYERGS